MVVKNGLYIKGGTQAKGIWKQDPEANIWTQMMSGEGSTMSNFIFCTVHLILSGWLSLEDWDGQVMYLEWKKAEMLSKC